MSESGVQASREDGARIDTYGPVSVLVGPAGGRYPEGNSILVRGARETIVIDPSLGLDPHHEAGALPKPDRILLSHCHEDHIAGNPLWPDLPVFVHPADAPGLESLDAMLAIYGFTPEVEKGFRSVLVDQFRWQRRTDVHPIDEGDRIDLGDVTVDVLHTPGHTRGHCCFLVRFTEAGRERSLLYLGDIELTSFGPYYGDAWSDLSAFEASLARVRDLECDWYATFHHIGVLEGREAFLDRLDRFESMIGKREARLVEFVDAAPRSLAEIARHRFVYRQGDPVPFADPVEIRSMSQHLERLVARGRVQQLEDGRFRGRP